MLQHVLRGVGDDNLGTPTPCTQFTVDQLAEHLLGSITSIGTAAGATFADAWSATLESRIAGPAQRALKAWRRRGVEETVELGSATEAAVVAVQILSLEFLVDAWDFAAATGREVVLSEPLTA